MNRHTKRRLTPAEIFAALEPVLVRTVLRGQLAALAKSIGVPTWQVYRWRNKLLVNPVPEALERRGRGDKNLYKLDPRAEKIVADAIAQRVALLIERQKGAREQIQSLLAMHKAVVMQCECAGVPAPSYSTVLGRWQSAVTQIK